MDSMLIQCMLWFLFDILLLFALNHLRNRYVKHGSCLWDEAEGLISSVYIESIGQDNVHDEHECHRRWTRVSYKID